MPQASAAAPSADAPAREGFAALRIGPRDRGSSLPESVVADADTPPSPAVAIDPMVGWSLEDDDAHLVLLRNVRVDGRGYRQGVILDRARLTETLARDVLESEPTAAGAVAGFGPPDEAPAADGDELYSFVHRFGEPFEALALRLDLRPLEGGESAAPLYALCALVALAVGAGLFAVYRMTAVTVEFAERRSNFVSAVSHELKTPLTSIRMYGEMLRDGVVPSEDRRDEYARTITDESERLSRLIDNVLEFSRLEKGRREVAVSAGDVGPLVAEAVEKLRPHAARAGFALHAEVASDLPPVLFERDALLQILFNLVDNGLKYAAASEAKEIVIACERSADGDGVELRVRDYGPGVPPAHLARVFEPFYRSESELTRQTRGSGIGLALVRELADAMNAAVSGENAEDGGFRVRLVLRPA